MTNAVTHRSQSLAAAEASGSVRAPADGEEELLTLQRKWTAAAPLESVQAASECRYGAKCCRKNVPAPQFPLPALCACPALH